MTDYSKPHVMPQHLMEGVHADRRNRATNERLEQILDQARADSEEQRKLAEEANERTRQAIRATWAGVGVAIIVGVTTILVTLLA